MANKIVISAAILGAFTAVYGLLIKPDFNFSQDWLVVVWAAFIATVGIVGNRLRGQAASLTTMVTMSGVNVGVLEMPEGANKYVLAAFQASVVLIAVFWSSPPKPVEYEKTPLMAEAKKEVKEMKEVAKDTAIKEEIKELKKELEPDPAKLPRTDSGVN